MNVRRKFAFAMVLSALSEFLNDPRNVMRGLRKMAFELLKTSIREN